MKKSVFEIIYSLWKSLQSLNL